MGPMNAAGFLAQVRARLRRVLLLEGLARTLALAIAIIVVIVAADFTWPTPGWFRLCALVALIVAVAVIARRRMVRPLSHGMDDRTLARFVERRLPALDGRLLTAIDGIELGDREGTVLGGQLTATAANALVPAPRMGRWLSLAGTAIACLVMTAFVFPRFAHDAMARLFLPLGGAEWARGTTLDARLDPAVVASDRKPTVIVERHHWKGGRDREDFQAPVLVSWEEMGSGHRESRQLPGLRGTTWQAPLPALPPGIYRILVESGDAVPVVLEVRSVRRPSLGQVTATLTPPAYTKLPPQRIETLSCTVLPGTRFDVRIAFATDPGRTIARAGIAMSAGDVPGDIATTTAADGSIGASFVIARGGDLVLTAEDQDGIGMEPPPRFALTKADDRVPVVSLDGPSRNEAVGVRAMVGLAIDASDDFALGRLELLGAAAKMRDPVPGEDPTATAPSAEKAKPMAEFPQAVGSATTSQRVVIEVAKWAGLGETLVLTGRAEDTNDVTVKGVAVSEPLTLRVVSDEALRQELDRLISEARERTTQAREEIGHGLAKPAKLGASARAATIAAEKSRTLLDQVLRRWRENALPAEQIAPADQARSLLGSAALPKLAETASSSADLPAREADQALAQIEKLLGSLLQEGDLTRRLHELIAKETSLAEESRAFVLEHLTKPLDAGDKTRQANIAERQRAIAEDVKDIERQVLASSAAQLEAAKEHVRQEPAGDRLAQAAGDLGSQAQRPRGVESQRAGLESMKKLLEALRGGDAAGDLANRVGELAAREEALVKELDAGTRPQDLAERQKEIDQDIERLQEEIEKQDPEAAKAAAAAAAAGKSAAEGMSKGDRSAAGRDASSSANLLREAQKKLGGDEPEPEKPEDKKDPDVVALLRELLSLQTGLVTDSTLVHARLGDREPDFTATREIAGFAERESDIVLRLREEGLKALAQNPIATIGLNRVAVAMDKAVEHLSTPALGERGLRLEKIALAELSRLVDIADNPTPDSSGGGGGGGGGAGTQAPFPQAAELALLASMQEEIARLTDANRPGDLAAAQGEVRDLVEVLENTSRPGSRPNVLLARSHRAMASAAALLGGKDRGLTTRHEQVVAEAALRRLLAEAQGGGGGSGKPQGKPPPRKNGDSGKPPPSDGDPQKSDAQSPAGAAAGGNPGSKQADQRTGVIADQRGVIRIELPEVRREQLRQAREQNLAPRALQLYERYLEVLEQDP